MLKIDSIFVETDIINGSYVDGKLSPVIYSFFPNALIQDIENPINLVFLPLHTHTINTVIE